jgi:AcrR family transcriptional regulator
MSGKGEYHHGDLKNALIEAGIAVLAQDGVSGLSLRKVASRAGVSHAAPYAHFADKQALIAAISTEGYRKLYAQLRDAAEHDQDDPARQLVGVCWAYVAFALTDTAHFRITLSGALEKEKDYPAFVEVSKRCFAFVVTVVETSQAASILPQGPADLVAVSLWGMLHGLVSLVLEDQVSHTILDRLTLKELLLFSLNLMAQTHLGAELLP